MYTHRKMVAKKNRKWLEENKDKSEFKPYKDYPEVYEKIDKLFCDDKKRKWILHLITTKMVNIKTLFKKKTLIAQ